MMTKTQPTCTPAVWAWLEPYLVLLFFAVIVSVPRLYTLPMSVVTNSDESIYVLMGQSMLKGEPPYVVVWDHKPLGLPMLYAMAQVVVGPTIASARILNWFLVTLSCFLLYLFGKHKFTNTWTGLLAGTLYAIFSLNNEGVLANAEIAIAPFTILAFYLLFGKNKFPGALTAPKIILSGLCAGLSLQISPIAAADVGAIGLTLALAIYLTYPAGWWRVMVRWHGLFLAMILLVWAGFLGYMAYFGSLTAYFNANFAYQVGYVDATQTSVFAEVREVMVVLTYTQIPWNGVLWLAVLLTPVFWLGFRRTYPESTAHLGILLLWFGFAFLGTNVTGRYYTHYYLLLLPPMCLLTAYIAVRSVATVTWRPLVMYTLLGLLLLVLSFPVMGIALIRTYDTLINYPQKISQDTPRQIATYLDQQMDEPGYVYIVSDFFVAYYLTDKAQIASPYVFSAHLANTGTHGFAALNTSPLAELDQTMALPPIYVIVDSWYFPELPFYDRLEEHLAQDYTLETTINEVLLYRRKE